MEYLILESGTQIIIPFGNDSAIKRVIEHRFSIRCKKYNKYTFSIPLERISCSFLTTQLF